MTGRERIMAALNHQEPDRIPRDLGSTPSSGISAIAYGNLLDHLQMPKRPIKIYDVVQQVVQVDDDVVDHYGIDVLDIGRTFNTASADWKPFPLADGKTGYVPAWFNPVPQADGSFLVYQHDTLIARMPVGATFFDQTCFPYLDDYPESFDDLDEQMKMVLWSALVHSPWDHSSDPNFWQELRARALKLRAESDRALMVVCGCNLFEWGTFLRRIDNFLCDLLVDEENVQRLLDALLQIHLRTLENVCRAVGDVCDILRFGDDLGINTGPFMQPDIYRRLFKPYHQKLNEYVHRHSNMKTFLHSCGSIYRLLPDLIEAGYDVINPVQISAFEMDPKTLKKEFGKDITFWGGGCDTRDILNHGTPEHVREHVKQMADIFAPGGGFVFGAVHNILPDCPPENIDAMFTSLDQL
ncbi:MAG: methyltransferase [Clostridia bacterium]|nr:methyltransferase [Clostridia bacterium]